MFKGRKLVAVLGAAGLSLIGLQALVTSSAAAAPARAMAAAQPGYRAPATARVARHPVSTAVRAGIARSTSIRPQAAAPSSFQPSCYGDSRTIAPQSATFDPASFGAFYNCSSKEWTFEVQTKDSWAKTSLGDLTIFIDTSGSFLDGCGGFEYQAFVAQVAANSFQADVVSSTGDPSGQNCSFGSLMPASMSITANTVSVSFPAADLIDPTTGAQGTAIAWDGLLQSLTEANASAPEGQFVPASSFEDANVFGAVLDSIPAVYPSASCGNSPPTGAFNATTDDGAAATAALQKAGFANVRNDSEGIVSFSGDGAAASRVLSAAGVSAKVALARPMMPASYSFSAASATAPVNDPDYSSQWNLPVVGAPGAWAVTHGTGLVVADIDTGVDFTHPDLSANLVAGEDETTNPASAMPTSSGDTDTGQNASGHGTAVAGVIAAVTNNGIGLASLGYDTKVEPVKVNFDDQTNVDGEIAAGILWAAANTTNPVSVINLSLGGPCYDPTVASAIDTALADGILVVAAAGNEAIHPGFDPAEGASDAESYPAADPCVAGDKSCIISVGATGEDGYRAAYSDTGSYVTVVAPGGSGDTCNTCPPAPDNLPLLAPGNNYTSGAGTSFAAPQVAATASLIWSVNSKLTPSQVRELIVGTATDMGPPGFDLEYGNGMLNASAALADTPPSTTTSPTFGTFTAQNPTRILDTRSGLGAPKAQLGPGGVLALTIPGASSGVSAAVLNVTETNASKGSFLTLWPAGQAQPNSSSLNFPAGRSVPNLVTVKVGPGGVVDIFNSVGSTDVIADLEGTYGDGTLAPGSTFVSTAPKRLLDTRTTGGPIAANTSRTLQITGGTVPSTATGIVANVTVTGPTRSSFLTVYPESPGSPVPTVSNLNFAINETVANMVVVKLGPTGAISLYNAFGSVHVIVDLEGYFTAAGDATGSRFFPLVNHRILDTRFNVGGFYGPIGQSAADNMRVVGAGGVIDGANAVVFNMTVTQGTHGSFLEVYPTGGVRPVASNLNFVANTNVANLVSVSIGNNGQDSVYNAFGTADAIADVDGWYGTPGT